MTTSAITVDLGDELVLADVVRSDRARVTRIQVGADRPLRVIVPAGASDEFARDAVQSKRAWVQRKLRRVKQATSSPATLGLDRHGVVWVAGEPLPLVRAGVRFAMERDGVLLAPEGNAVTQALQRWYRRRARAYLAGLVQEEAARLGASPLRVAIRDQRTRWGSCARSGTLSLNWRLLLVPEPVARYVVIHELVHLDVPNHSKAFWRALATACPDWRQHAAWLREHGAELRAYDVPRSASGSTELR